MSSRCKRWRIFMQVILALAVFDTLQKAQAQLNDDLNRPYNFGFTIDNEQHRQEEKNLAGLIMGEYGFITADGFYHTTVYTTDAQGRFNVLDSRKEFVGFPPLTPIRPGLSSAAALTSHNSLFGSPFLGSTQSPFVPDPIEIPSPRPFNSVNSILNSLSPNSNFNSVTSTTVRTTLLDSNRYDDIDPSIMISSPRPFQAQSITPTTYRPPLRSTIATPLPTGYPERCTDCINKPFNTPSPNFKSTTAGFTSTNSYKGNSQTSTSSTSRTNSEESSGSTSTTTENSRAVNNNPYNRPEKDDIPVGGYRSTTPTTVPRPVPFAPSGAGSPFRNRYQDINAGNNRQNPYRQRNQNYARNDDDEDEDAERKQDDGNEKKRQFISDAEDNELGGSGLHYKFNYTAKYHGHSETGFKDGSKTGDYFVNTKDGVSHRVTYEANENGYQPVISQVKISPEETPKSDNEDANNLVGTGIDFVWFTKKK